MRCRWHVPRCSGTDIPAKIQRGGSRTIHQAYCGGSSSSRVLTKIILSQSPKKGKYISKVLHIFHYDIDNGDNWNDLCACQLAGDGGSALF
jgi:hypothetical protein